MHAHGGRALELGGGVNGEPLTSGCRAESRPGSRSSCCRRLRGGALDGMPESTQDESVLITSETRLSICGMDAWLGNVEPRSHLLPLLRAAPDAQAQMCSRASTARKMIRRSTARRDWTALGAAITPTRRPQWNLVSAPHSERWLSVHYFSRQSDGRTEPKNGGGCYFFKWTP